MLSQGKSLNDWQGVDQRSGQRLKGNAARLCRLQTSFFTPRLLSASFWLHSNGSEQSTHKRLSTHVDGSCLPDLARSVVVVGSVI